MSQDDVFLSPVDSVESDLLSDGSDFDVGDDFILAIDIGSLISIANGERVLQGNCGDSMAGDEGPVNATDLGSRVDKGSCSD